MPKPVDRDNKKAVAPYGYTKRGTPRKRPAREGEGNREHEPTDELRSLVKMYGIWATQKQIAQRLNIAVETLLKHYPDELRTCKLEADNFSVSQLMTKIRAGDTSAIIWYQKAFMGRSERYVVEQEATIVHERIRERKELAKLTAQELVALYREQIKAPILIDG